MFFCAIVVINNLDLAKIHIFFSAHKSFKHFVNCRKNGNYDNDNNDRDDNN